MKKSEPSMRINRLTYLIVAAFILITIGVIIFISYWPPIQIITPNYYTPENTISSVNIGDVFSINKRDVGDEGSIIADGKTYNLHASLSCKNLSEDLFECIWQSTISSSMVKINFPKSKNISPNDGNIFEVLVLDKQGNTIATEIVKAHTPLS